jgi:predicted nucleic acid-binding protein
MMGPWKEAAVEEPELAGASVYLETTVIGYLTSWPSRDIVVAARQQLTHQWWQEERHRYRVLISPYVVEEAQGGDPSAAEERLRVVEQLELLEPPPGIVLLAEKIQSALHIPLKAKMDAFHLAFAVHYELDYLLTWNCVHLASAPRLRLLADFLKTEALWLPIVCTPAEMVEQGEET